MEDKTLLFVYDENLQILGGFDGYASLIWASRYQKNGDCEIYAPATDEALDLLKIGRFVRRVSDPSICILRSVEITSSPDGGNFITAKGYNVSSLLDRRIVWKTSTCYGNAEKFVYKLANEALGAAAEDFRQYKANDGTILFTVGSPVGLKGSLSQQVTYKVVGETIREICVRFGWGVKVDLVNDLLHFSIWNGADRTDTVIFSDELENLIESDYSRDESEALNVSVIAGEGEGADRARQIIGDAAGRDRFEMYVDARDLSKTITYGELISAYPRQPQGSGYIDYINDQYVYRLPVLDIQIYSQIQLAQLQEEYPSGQIVTVDGVQYWRLRNVVAAELPSVDPESEESVTLTNAVYQTYLAARGVEKLAATGVITSFEGQIEPSTTFTFGEDYFLGDIVTVRNHFGITAAVRIIEVIECYDENGYSVEPKFEMIGGVRWQT